MPITNPLTPKIAGVRSRMRSSSTVRACWSGVNSGARIPLTICGANAQHTMLNNVRIRITRLTIEEANLQAPLRSSFSRNSVSVGIKAEANAPPATKTNRISGIRSAALKASISTPVPNTRASKALRTSPTILLNTNPAMTTPAARAIWRLAVLLWSLCLE